MNFPNVARVRSEDLIGILKNCTDKSGNVHELSYPTLWDYENIINIFFVNGVIIFGIIGNILSAFILSIEQKKNPTIFILLWLTVIDSLFLVVCFFFQPVYSLAKVNFWLKYSYYYERYIGLFYTTGQCLRITRNWTVVLVTAERYLAVRNPLKTAILWHSRKWRNCLILIFLFGLLVNMPRFLFIQTLDLLCKGHSKSDNQTYEISAISITKNRPLVHLILIMVSQTFTVLLPIIFLVIVNYKFRQCLKKAYTERCLMIKQSSDGSKSGSYVDKKMTEINKIIIGVIGFYLFCEILSIPYQILTHSKLKTAITILKPINNLLVCFNSSGNFLVYVFLGKRFRHNLFKVVRRKTCFQSRTNSSFRNSDIN